MFLRPKTSVRAIWQQGQLAKRERVVTKAKAARLARELRLAVAAVAIAIATKATLAYKLVNS